MTALRACLFDLDGVLVDTQRLHTEAWAQVAKELGLPFDAVRARRLAGRSRADSLRLLLDGRRMAAPLFDATLLYKGELTERLLERIDPSWVLPGTRMLLDALRRRGVRCAVASASRHAEDVLYLTGLRSCFTAVVDGRMVNRPKPDPEVFLRAAAALLSRPRHAVVLEDSAAGVEAARRGGFPVIGVRDATLPTERWVPDLAALTMRDLDEAAQALAPSQLPTVPAGPPLSRTV